MEPEVEEPGNGGSETWLRSTGSRALHISDRQDGSCYDDTWRDEEFPMGPELPEEDTEDWKDLKEQSPSSEHSLGPGRCRPPDNVLSQETGSVRLGSPLPSQVSSQSPDSEPDPIPRGHSPVSSSPTSSSSSSSSFRDRVRNPPSPTPPPPPPPPPKLGPGTQRQGPGTGARGGVESPDEEAPPARVASGIPGQGAEQAEARGSDSERDRQRRASRHRARLARLNESQLEKQVKEAKSKCKRIALLLTDAPNPRNKGALLFKKRRQRVKKYTFVSYGTGQEEEREDIGSDEGKDIGFGFLSPFNSEPEEDCLLHPQDPAVNFRPSWDGLLRSDDASDNPEQMEHLPETKGKGVMMFAQRRQRMEEIALQHEEMRRRGIPVEGVVVEPEHAEAPDARDTEETYTQPPEERDDHIYVDAHSQQQMTYPEGSPREMRVAHDMDSMGNHLTGVVPKPLVPNRTAKPFSGFQNRAPAPFKPLTNVAGPAEKRAELKFKVPVPVQTHAQVWSPTGDIIASRDERISVPAIKRGILPESRRRGNKQSDQPPNPYLQNTGERRSYIEFGQEEDFLSLGAEACNFMQPRPLKQKNPPPVAPKPTINPSCPPWSKEDRPVDAAPPPRSPVSMSSPCPAGPPPQQYLRQPLLDPQQMANPWAPMPRSPSQQQLPPPTAARAPAVLPLRSSAVSGSPQRPRPPVSTPTAAAPGLPLASWSESANPAGSVASCPPPKAVNSHVGMCKAPLTNPASATAAPPLKGRGAELFAKRQSRMEKFVVDGDAVLANQVRSPSPTSSLPSAWRYSPNVRAPPPLSYNPLLAPFYPPAAAKQPPSTSPTITPKAKAKPKPPPRRHLDPLDVMKHQPYQLKSSLFRYEAAAEAQSPSPKSSPGPASESSRTPTPSSAPAPAPAPAISPLQPRSPYSAHQQSKPIPPPKPAGPWFGRSHSLPRRLASMPSGIPASPASAPAFQPPQRLVGRQTSLPGKPHKPPSPWEAAARSPLGLVDEAFWFQDLPQSVASGMAHAHRRSLPEPPDEWKHRVSLDAPTGGLRQGYNRLLPIQPLFKSRVLSAPGKPMVYGPPFRPAQPLGSGAKVSIRDTALSMSSLSQTSNSTPLVAALRS